MKKKLERREEGGVRITRRGGRDIGERKGERKEGVRGEMREKREKEEGERRG